jgi:CheY-specific phosphatase CheX
MASEFNSVQESIKLALDAADAATDVTSEYSQVKREHKKLEKKVSQIHRYTTITFVSAISAAVIALAFSATLYFKSISELKLMTTTNRQGLIVFSENIETLNNVLAELKVSLSKQEELIRLNRESTSQIGELKKVMAEGSASIVAQLQKTGDGIDASTTALGESLKTAMKSQNKAMTNSFKVTLTSLESSVLKSVAAIDKKIASNKVLQSVAVSQTKTKKEIESLKLQTREIRKLLETQQNRVTFP